MDTIECLHALDHDSIGVGCQGFEILGIARQDGAAGLRQGDEESIDRRAGPGSRSQMAGTSSRSLSHDRLDLACLAQGLVDSEQITALGIP